MTFHYDAAGRLTQKTFPSQDSVHFKYDANDNLIELVPPGGDPQANPSEHHVFSHNGIDLLTSYTPPVVNNMQGATLVEYDDDHATSKVTRPGNVIVTPSYGATSGRLEALNLPNNETIAYTYDTAGRVATIASSRDGETQTLGYAGSLLSSVTWTGTVGGNTGASVAFAYDDDLRVTSETVSDGTTQHAASYLYEDADGLLTKAGDLTLTLDAPTGALHATSIGVVTDLLGYSEFGELTSYLAKASNIPFYAVDYERDALGRVTRKTETILGTTTITEYGYDAAGRLSDVYQGTAPCTPESPCSWVEHDAYDPNGNRTTSGDPFTPTLATYDAQDRILTYGGATHSYTPNGELASKGTTTFDWDALGQLRKVDQSASNGPVIEYLYDAQGHRIAKKYNGNVTTKWIYDGGPTPVAELYATGQLKLRFIYGTKPHVPDYMVVIATGATYRFITDQLGSVRLVVKTTDGSIAQRIDYDAWGTATVITGSVDYQPFGFAGGLTDADTGFIHFGAREYDPANGRWLSKDPLLFGGGTTNLYDYVSSDSVNHLDPNGLQDPFLGYVPSDASEFLGWRAESIETARMAAFETWGIDVFFQNLLWDIGFGRHEANTFVLFGHAGQGLSLSSNVINGFDANDVANWIRRQSNYSPGMSVQLNFCNAGLPGGLAQTMSKDLHVPVSGPNGTLSGLGDVDTDGEAWNKFLGGKLIGH